MTPLLKPEFVSYGLTDQNIGRLRILDEFDMSFLPKLIEKCGG